MTSSRFLSMTGKRECAVAITCGMNLLGVSLTSIMSICARGTMMSRTCISDTCSAPSIIDRASPSRRFLAKAECNSLSSCSRSSGSRMSSAESRSSREGLFDSSMFAAGPGATSSLAQAWESSPGSVVGIRITEFGKKLLFQGFHARSVTPPKVIVALQVQKRVDRQVRKMRFHRLALRERFSSDHGGAKDDVALHQAVPQHIAKTQHVGGIVAAPIATIEGASFGGSDYPHGDLGRPFERRARPSTNLRRSRHRRGARNDLKMEREARLWGAPRSCGPGCARRAAGPHDVTRPRDARRHPRCAAPEDGERRPRS